MVYCLNLNHQLDRNINSSLNARFRFSTFCDTKLEIKEKQNDNVVRTLIWIWPVNLSCSYKTGHNFLERNFWNCPRPHSLFYIKTVGDEWFVKLVLMRIVSHLSIWRQIMYIMMADANCMRFGTLLTALQAITWKQLWYFSSLVRHCILTILYAT